MGLTTALTNLHYFCQNIMCIWQIFPLLFFMRAPFFLSNQNVQFWIQSFDKFSNYYICNIFRTLSDGNGVNNGFDEPSLFLSKHWSKSQYVQPVNHQSQQPPFGRNNNNLESLKILTSELAENLGNGGGINGTGNNGINGGGNGSQRHHDSGYISPNFPPNSSNGSGGGGNGKAFFDGPNNPGHQAVLEHQPPVDPVLLQQVLQQQQQQQHPKQQPQQPMINHRPITGMWMITFF